MYILQVFKISILLFLTRKIAKAHVILAQNFAENNADLKLIQNVFLF
jgi:hypothetical protein